MEKRWCSGLLRYYPQHSAFFITHNRLYYFRMQPLFRTSISTINSRREFLIKMSCSCQNILFLCCISTMHYSLLFRVKTLGNENIQFRNIQFDTFQTTFITTGCFKNTSQWYWCKKMCHKTRFTTWKNNETYVTILPRHRHMIQNKIQYSSHDVHLPHKIPSRGYKMSTCFFQ